MIEITENEIHIPDIYTATELTIDIKDKAEGEHLKLQILKCANWMKRLEEKNLELRFCMFGCHPYLWNKSEIDNHFETACEGNLKL